MCEYHGIPHCVSRQICLGTRSLRRRANALLHVGPGGSKSWVQRVVVDGKRHDIGLGGFPAVSLSMARRRAAENRTAIAEGRAPLAEKRRSWKATFEHVAQKTCDALKPRWRNDKHTVSWMQTLQRHAFPILGSMTVDRIAREDVLRVLLPMWGTRPETARRVRQRIRTTLRWCWAHNYVSEKVAGRGNRWCATTNASCQGLALSRSCCGARYRPVVPSVGGREAVPSVSGSDGSSKRRGSRREMGRNMSRRAGVAHSRNSHEGRCRTSGSAVCFGHRSTISGLGTRRWFRIGVPIASAKRQGTVRYDLDQAVAVNWPC